MSISRRIKTNCVLLVIVATVAEARRLQQPVPHDFNYISSFPGLGSIGHTKSVPATRLALFLLALNPTSAFSCLCRPQLDVSRFVSFHIQRHSCRTTRGVCLDAHANATGPNDAEPLPTKGLVDLYFLGKLGNTLALAGQGAANQVYTTAGLLSSTLPSVAIPLVARAYAAGNQQEVQKQVGGALFLSFVVGALITLIVGVGNSHLLGAVGTGPSTLLFALPYLMYRLPGVIPDTAATVSAASLQGALDTKAPLKVSILALVTNTIGNYLLIFQAGMGIAGAAIATAISQFVAAGTYFSMLLRRKLVTWSTAIRPPSREMRTNLAGSIGALQVRNIALNLAFVAITRQVQTMDATGIAAAANNVAIQVWLVGGVFILALGIISSSLTSAELGREGSTPASARAVGKRLLAWGALMGGVLTVAQCAFATPLIALFSPSPEVQKAAFTPLVVGALLQIVNGIVFVGEGLMIAGGAYSMLAIGQVVATAAHFLALKLAPPTLTALWMCFWVWNFVRLASFVLFWCTKSPLLPDGRPGFWAKDKAA